MGGRDESGDCEWSGCELMLDAEDFAINRVNTRVTSCYECIKSVRICYSAFPRSITGMKYKLGGRHTLETGMLPSAENEGVRRASMFIDRVPSNCSY